MCNTNISYSLKEYRIDFLHKGQETHCHKGDKQQFCVFFFTAVQKKITAVCAGEALANGCGFVSVNSRGLMGFHSYPLMLGAVKLPHIYVCRGDKKEKKTTMLGEGLLSRKCGQRQSG